MPGGFGLPTVGTVPTDALTALFPWMTYGSDLASRMATTQYQGQNAMDQARIAANASVTGDRIRAGATTQAASIGAGATIQSQQIQTKGMLQALQAQINADAIRYRNGDIAAGQRLQASLRQQAELKNTDTALTLATMMGSGKLRDTIGARLAMRGMGAMPGASSALNGLENRIWADTNRTVDTPPEYAPVKVGMNIGGSGGGGSNFGGGSSFGGGGFGGGSGAIANSNLGGQYADLYNQIKGTLNFGDIFKFGNTPVATPPVSAAPVAPAAPITAPYDPTQGINVNMTNRTDPNYAKTITDLNNYFGIPAKPQYPPPGVNMSDPKYWENALLQQPLEAQRAARGGQFKETAAIVGDSPTGRPTGYEELVVGDNYKVIPLRRAAFGYDASTTDPNWDRNKLADAAKMDTNPQWAIDDAAKMAASTRPAIRTYDPADPRYAFGGGASFSAPAPIYGAGNQPTAEQRARKIKPRPLSNMPSKKFGTPAEAPPPAAAPPVATQPQGGAIPWGPTGGQSTQPPLADINNIPALSQIRTGNVLPAFGDMPSLSDTGLGITNTPAPYTRAATFGAMSPAEQEDMLQMWEFLGVPREVAMYQMAQTTPGFRMSPQRSFGF